MRVFLRSSVTGRYYGGLGQLDAGPDQAAEFTTVQAATKRALSAKLADVEVVLRCDYLSQEVSLPVVAEWGELAENYSPRIHLLTPPAASPAPPPC